MSSLSRAAAEVEIDSGLLGELRVRDQPSARPWFVLRSAVGPVSPTVHAFTAFASSAAADHRARCLLERPVGRRVDQLGGEVAVDELGVDALADPV